MKKIVRYYRNMVKNSKIALLLLSVILMISSVFSATALNIVLASQNPDPVAPGNFVYVNVKISNLGTDDITEASVEMIENENFKIAQGSQRIQSLGTIAATSRIEPDTTFVIAKFKILVDEETPQGLNTLEFKVRSTSGTYTSKFDILVEDENPLFQINSFEMPQIEPGQSGTLQVELENINSVALRDVIVTLNLNEISEDDSDVFTMNGGFNQQSIPIVRPDEKETVKFEITSSPDAFSRPYNIPLTITFEDALGNSYTQNIIGSVNVYSKPQLSLTLDSQEVYGVGSGRMTFAIANYGTSSIKGTRIEFLPSENYQILEGETQYIGDLNPDDFQTAAAQVYIKNGEVSAINAKISYLDSYNNLVEREVSVPVTIYSEDEIKQYGLSGASSSGSGAGTIIWLILLVIAFVVGRRMGISKGKKKIHN